MAESCLSACSSRWSAEPLESSVTSHLFPEPTFPIGADPVSSASSRPVLGLSVGNTSSH
jgi:hypothetical protein